MELKKLRFRHKPQLLLEPECLAGPEVTEVPHSMRLIASHFRCVEQWEIKKRGGSRESAIKETLQSGSEHFLILLLTRAPAEYAHTVPRDAPRFDEP
ncbi:hypothetical protein SRHO_G00054360 [Serrasalmus rhombeus]